MTMSDGKQFSSEGFDLDAAPGNEDVIYELGGGATAVETKTEVQKDETKDDGPISKSEEFKLQGNAFFKEGAYLDAIDMYTDAIEACPGMKGEELLNMKEKFDEEQRELALQRHRELEEERRKNERNGEQADRREYNREPLPEFEAPPHDYGEKLAVYYCNRAACLLHEQRFSESIEDCNVAVLLNPKYTKAWIRRSTAYEKTERTEEALADAKTALELEPGNAKIRSTVSRLQKLEDERLEKLKAETMDKLKDLGNSILGNFGLSLDNFKTVQDPNTGSYSISFENK